MIKKTCRTLSIFLMATTIAFMQLPILGQPQIWYSNLKQIKVLETKRDTVENLLQPAKIITTSRSAVGTNVEYQIRQGSISVLYSHSTCITNIEYGYNVEKDTVIEIEIRLRKPIKISKFGFDLSKFQKMEIEDVVGLFNYTNEDYGQEFYGTSTKLSSLILSPSKEQEKLACAIQVEQGL